MSIPELGRIEAPRPPIVILTSNRTRDVHDALKRRCLYHWVGHPSLEIEIDIIMSRVAAATTELATTVARAVRTLRNQSLYKAPGVAESIDWVRALGAMATDSIDVDALDASLGVVLKYHEDIERVREKGLDELVRAADG